MNIFLNTKKEHENLYKIFNIKNCQLFKYSFIQKIISSNNLFIFNIFERISNLI